jgi:iron complex outermembrane receptor protein
MRGCIPGVTPQFFNVRLIYDQTKGRLRGFGAFAEEDIRSSFFLDNANLLRAPGSNVLNLEVHYTPPVEHGLFARLNFYAEVRNLTSKAYVSSASNITDSLNSTTGAENGVSTLATSGVIWAGPPRAIFGGIRVKLSR